MALNQWFKFYGGEFLSDPKIASLSAQERSCWMTLLCLASISSTPGIVEFLTVEVLLTKSGIEFNPYSPEEWNASLAVLEKFVRMKMITKSEEGVIEIMNWKKRQETALTNAERQARYRGTKGSNEKVTGHVTNVTLDKNREDKNKNDDFKSKSSSFEKTSTTDSTSTAEYTREPLDEEYGTPRPKKPEPLPKTPRAPLLAIQGRFGDMCQAAIGTRPTPDKKGLAAIKFALNTGGLSEKQIISLFEDWFDQRKPEEQLMSINAALSSNNINKFKINNV